MRISDAAIGALALLLVGCGVKQPEATPSAQPTGAVDAKTQAERDTKGEIVCAAAGSEEFARVCRVDTAQTKDGTVLTLRHPDGGFRRLLITRDGRGVISADGAEAAKVTVIGKGEIEVAVGGVRYRLPATIGPVTK